MIVSTTPQATTHVVTTAAPGPPPGANNNAGLQGQQQQQQPQQAQGPGQAGQQGTGEPPGPPGLAGPGGPPNNQDPEKRKLVTRMLMLLLHAQWCSRKDKDAMNSGGTVQPVSTFIPCPFTGSKMLCAGPNILSQPKNLTAFNASSKTFLLA